MLELGKKHCSGDWEIELENTRKCVVNEGEISANLQLAFTQYVGVMTIVLVKKAIRPVISRVETSERGIGLMGFVVSRPEKLTRMFD